MPSVTLVCLRDTKHYKTCSMIFGAIIWGIFLIDAISIVTVKLGIYTYSFIVKLDFWCDCNRFHLLSGYKYIIGRSTMAIWKAIWMNRVNRTLFDQLLTFVSRTRNVLSLNFNCDIFYSSWKQLQLSSIIVWRWNSQQIDLCGYMKRVILFNLSYCISLGQKSLTTIANNPNNIEQHSFKCIQLVAPSFRPRAFPS